MQQHRRQATAPPPPVTPEQLVQARKPAPQWPTWSVGAGIIVLAGRSMATTLTPTTAAQQQVLSAVRSYGVVVASALITIGLIALLIRWSWEPKGAAAIRVLSAAGKALHLGPNQLTLAKTSWKRGWRKRLLTAGVLRYAAGHVTEDLSEDLELALEPFTLEPLQIIWDPNRDRFVMSLPAHAEPRLEERHSAVGSITRTLEHILGELDVDQAATSVSPQGALVALVATYKYTTRDMAESFRQRVKTMLDLKSPCPTGAWLVKLDPASSRVTVTPSKKMETIAPLPLNILTRADRMRIPIGMAAGGEIIYWEPAVFPHMLLVGPTGSGKTIMINSIIDLVAARGWLIDLLDPKETSFRGYIPATLERLGMPVWPGINRVATSEQEFEEAIDDLYEDLRERYYQLKIFGVTERALRPRLGIIDEAGELVERLNAYHTSEAKYLDLVAKAIQENRNPDEVIKPKGTRNPILAKIWSLLRLGRQAKIYVITATQRPDVNFIPGEARSNLVCRVAMGKQDGAALEMVFNTRAIQQRVHELEKDGTTGELIYKRIRGRATVDVGEGPVSVQTFWTPDPSLVITGELDDKDQALVAAQFAYVCQEAARWSEEGELNPEWTGFQTAAPTDIVDRKKHILDAVLDKDLASPAAPITTKDLASEAKQAKALTVGDVTVLEINGENLTVEITEIEDDPTYLGEQQELHELQITYCIAEGHDRAGEVGVTSLVDDESVLVEA